MKALLYKELQLGVHPFFYGLPFITGALMLIPGWIYLVVFMYFCFITVPNMFATYKTNNDLMFSIMMPVRKKDILKARISLIVFLELLHILAALLFTFIHLLIYKDWFYYFTKPGVAFFGLAFGLYAVFNVVFFPIYSKTAYKYGMATVMATAAMLAYSTFIEYGGIKIVFIQDIVKSNHLLIQYIVLVVGFLAFVLSGIIAYYMSVKHFERVDA